MADRINATMHRVQPASRHPPPHPTRAQADVAQLRKRDDTVLLQSEGRNRLVPKGLVTLRATWRRNVTGLAHGAILVAGALPISTRLRRLAA